MRLAATVHLWLHGWACPSPGEAYAVQSKSVLRKALHRTERKLLGLPSAANSAEGDPDAVRTWRAGAGSSEAGDISPRSPQPCWF